MKKRVNTDAIKNELEGSVFFPTPTQPVNPPQKQEQETERSNARTVEQVNESTPVQSNERTNGRSKEVRQTKRQSYEFYADQIEAIKFIAREEEDRGGRDNKSKIVREAIDEYLARRKSRTVERSNDR